MKLVLPNRKIKNELWQQVWDNVPEYISREEVQEFVDVSLEEMYQVFSRYENPIYGWSAGKDSIVLADLILNNFGIIPAVLASYGELEYPSMVDWVTENAPPDLFTYINPIWEVEWLLDHEDHLFPSDGQGTYFYAVNGTHWAQRQLYQQVNADLLVLGRRQADGNYIRSDGDFGIHANPNKIYQYSPIRQWPNEAVLGYLHYNGLALSPCYFWDEQGWTMSTHPWAGRKVDDPIQGWLQLWRICPEVVMEHGPKFDSGKEALDLLLE